MYTGLPFEQAQALRAYQLAYIGGVGDFVGNFVDMMDATHFTGGAHNGWPGQDAYFHCKANCQATQRGPGGKAAAQCMSDTRESVDQLLGDSPIDSAADQAANTIGRLGASFGLSCAQTCSAFKPGGGALNGKGFPNIGSYLC
jgi:hypothetical protein